MKKKIFGYKYNYLVELTKNDNYYFEIWATYKKSRQVSVITNLNYILSEFQNEINNEDRFYETTWMLMNKTEGNNIWKQALRLFYCYNFIKVLENKLDDDRIQGGWNSDFKF